MKICPEWLSYQTINENKILKMDKSLSMLIVHERVEKGKL